MRPSIRHRARSHRRLLGSAAAGALQFVLPRRVVAASPASFPIGASVQGRPILATRFGEGPVRLLALGDIHTGEEANTVALVDHEAEGNEAGVDPDGAVTGRALAQVFAVGTGMDYLARWTAYPITGQLLKTLEEMGIPGVDVELPDHAGSFVAEDLAGLQRVMAAVTAAPR